MTLAQGAILASAFLSLPLLINSRPATPWHRIGCAIALAGQPFWLIETMRADLFGVFVVALWFTGLYTFGLLRPSPAPADPIEYVDLQRRR